ncbi:hypothetical protein Poli38472_007060 [Pythium oligandrum]|uniref:Protein kinase domain-containing protein n=1 Tax=Pythium oligandrum TaxID=41045 RepID=A0A8K1C9E5_PYTOL|nr:hypothetical protein Poli38472_007060 [Pythium oligandrum]|eukprot:TMW58915.1 hypothetical protein Poli38472_007060 [Pythium oligandrum]
MGGDGISRRLRAAIHAHSGFLLGAPLPATSPASAAALYYAFSPSGGVLAAKVFTDYATAFDHEVAVNLQLEIGYSVVKFISSFSVIEHGDDDGSISKLGIIIMPFFPQNAADFLQYQSPMCLNTITVIARDCIRALHHLHSKNYCYGDMKPTNIMLQGGEQGRAMLVDFGATVALGAPLLEATARYCLDIDVSVGTEMVDWVCLGSTLAELSGFDLGAYCTTKSLIHDVEEAPTMDTTLQEMIVSLLRGHIVDKPVLSALLERAGSFSY